MKGAPKGNEFWRLRSRHGRKRLFETPELLWEACCEYFQWCVENPLKEERAFNTKDSGIVKESISKMRAFTMQGLCLYLNCNVNYFNDFEKSIKGKKDDLSKGFSEVITRARDIIYMQKFEGAAADLLNHNIIARDLGLIDRKGLDANISEVKPIVTKRDV